MSERIAKRMARAGVGSRREAERWITDGRVALDGVPVTTPATLVEASQKITLDGEPIPEPQAAVLVRFHKPKGLITARRDPEGRPTIYDRLAPEFGALMPIGRLDLNSEGLLLLTNDGGLKRHIELPSTGWRRRYRVRVYGRVQLETLKPLSDGITVDGVRFGPIEARIEQQKGANGWLEVGLREGKNREVRKAMEHIGLQVNRLIRTAYGPFQLGSLKVGQAAVVPAKVMREQLGKGVVDGL
ncbi:MAG: pseudouridine synthase [Geminicoccaceae bacterium]